MKGGSIGVRPSPLSYTFATFALGMAALSVTTTSTEYISVHAIMNEESGDISAAVMTRLPENSIVVEEDDVEEEVVTEDQDGHSFWTLGLVGGATQKARKHKRSSSTASNASSLGIGDEAIDEIVSSVLQKDGESNSGSAAHHRSNSDAAARSLKSKTLSTNSLLKKSAEQAKAITETASKELADKLAILEESFAKAMREKDKQVRASLLYAFEKRTLPKLYLKNSLTAPTTNRILRIATINATRTEVKVCYGIYCRDTRR